MDIHTFLFHHKTYDTNAVLTHLSLAGGKYHIPENRLNEFYEAYVAALQTNTPLHLTEKLNLGDTFRFYLDIDFTPDQYLNIKTILGSGVVLSDIMFLRGLRDMVLMVLEHQAQHHTTLDEIVVSVRLPYKIHINVPTFACNRRIAHQCLEALKNLFAHCLLPNELNTIFDSGVYRNGLRMLGSTKRGSDSYYKVVDFETSSDDEIHFKNITVDLLKKTIIRTYLIDDEELQTGASRHSVVNSPANIDEEVFQSYCNEVALQINHPQLLLQISRIKQAYGRDLSFVIQTHDRFCPFYNRPHRRHSDYIYLFVTRNGARLKCYNEECKDHFLPVAADHTQQFFALNNRVAHVFREQNPRYILTDKDIEMLNRFCGENFAIDNELKEFSLMAFNNPSHDAVAKMMYPILVSRIRCSLDQKNNIGWYEHRDHCFKSLNYTSNLVINLCIAYCKLFVQYVTNNAGDNEPEVNMEKIEQFIRNYNHQKHLLLAIAGEFASRFIPTDLYSSWKESLDNNPNLVCFKNGVLDLGTMNFRPGRIEDGITLQLGGNYIPFEAEDTYTQQVLHFFEDLFPNSHTRDFIFKIFAKGLSGHRDEDFFILTGNGANGKSKLIGLLGKAFGSYFEDINVALFTNKRAKSNQAAPDVMAIKGKRICAFQEPEDDSKLNMGLIKQFCGNDYITGRELYCGQQKFKPQAAFFMCCNNIPEISASDTGTWRRINIITMKAQFVDNPRLPFQKPKDENLKSKMELWPDAFLSILCHYYHRLQTEGVHPSEDMTMDKRELRKEVDYVNYFINQKLEACDDESQFLTLKVIHENYVVECKQNDMKPQTKLNLKRILSENFRAYDRESFMCKFQED